MAINIKSKETPAEPAEEPKSPHEQAAENIESSATISTSSKDESGNEQVSQEHTEHHIDPVPPSPVPMQRVEVGMGFKMPIPGLQYHMISFDVRRSVPYNPKEQSADGVFEETKDWVEAKINSLIEENQPEG